MSFCPRDWTYSLPSLFKASVGSMLLHAELIDYIFSFLRGDISALEACSKSHPFFSQLAERHLYADIVVTLMDNLSVPELYECLSKNPHILGYPRTLKIYANSSILPRVLARKVLPIFSMIPRMANLTSLKLCEKPSGSLHFNRTFLSTLFESCLQQSSVEKIHLSRFRDLPLSILDNVKNIKMLTLSGCQMITEPKSKLPHQLLETLVIRGAPNKHLLIGMADRVVNLTSLQLRGVYSMAYDWNGFPELLAACSSSLTELHIDVVHRMQPFI